ncbi:glycosyltransferase [Flavobacterium sp. FBOR7N2.3]|uniref:Glycosyltransferase n=1 Tax=Flavobacterium magnesitis TaxID=3138077 RepID=A0ABV4TMY0_9FLAO
MKIIKSIKIHFRKKRELKRQGITFIPNLDQFNLDQKTIVFISNTLPKYDQDSGSNRLKEIIISYKEMGYNCIICVENIFEADKYVTFFNDLGIIVYLESHLHKNYIAFLNSIHHIDYIWYNGPKNLNRYFSKLSKYFPESKSIYDMIDIHFLRYKRGIELEPFRISLRKKYYRYFKIETELAKKTDVVIAISEVEKEIMSQYLKESQILLISNIHYCKIDGNKIAPFEKRNDILFIGSSHEPNIDAIHYLYNEIMPKVWLKLPNIKVNVIGNVKNKIHSISHPNFNLLGFVENIESYFISSKLMVAPLRYGGGVKGKIGQSFEYFLPVITTPIGAEGMFLVNKKNAYISETADEFSNQIIKLYNNKEIWSKLSDNSTESLYPFSKEKLKSVLKEI